MQTFKGIASIKKFLPNCIESTTPGWIGHLPLAYWIVARTRPSIIAELGTHFGNSYFTFCQSVKKHRLNTKCYAIDCWEGDEQAGTYGKNVFEKVSEYNDENYSSFSTLLRKRFQEALSNFTEGSIDILHIDGLHTYEAVKHDFESWKPKLSQKSIVLFHDIVVEKDGFGVKKYWEELKKTYPNYLEFKHSYGMGVLYTGTEPLPYSFLKPGSFQQWLMKRIISKSGLKMAVDYKKDAAR